MRKMDKKIDDFNIKNQVKLQEENAMKKNLFASKKLKAAVVVGALCVMSFTCYAAMKITGYTSHSYKEWDNLPTAEQVQKKVNFEPKFIESFTNGFEFDSASVGAIYLVQTVILIM